MKVEKIIGHNSMWGYIETEIHDIPVESLILIDEFHGNSSESSAAGINWHGNTPPTPEKSIGLFRYREYVSHGSSIDDLGNRLTKVKWSYYYKIP